MGMDLLYIKMGTYTIIFNVDTLENVNQLKESEFSVLPNPARDFIRIKPSIKGGKYSGCIFNVSGWPEKSLNEDDFNGREIYIGDLKPGIYFLVLRQNDIHKVFKIVKL